ncbi:tripartite motif-containing protein 16-like protein isoform X2 [Tachysurus vachellii]|uniref:tripartite motif-containing protein 16-like protein isoform X2 n=1 Tax=Tachysurus vachellii TaxID=175792 RepID=UPI00296ADE42|nr:tripartite motif-containing protein 16-like protein isoform X2 [Tachysurus vachellii]
MCTKSSSSFSLSEGSGEPFLIPEKTKVRVSLSCILSLCEFRKMAEASISVDQFSVDQFICPVCLDLLKDPVSLSCGHSFCKVCINDCWDQEDQSGVYSCPQCRDTFTPRPVLRRNNMLAEVVEKLKKTEVQAASLDHCYAGPGDVECDFCTERKQKAVKYCLMVDKHRGHDTVTAAEERTEKQNELQVEQLKSQQRLQEKQKKVQELKQAVNTIKLIAQTEVEDNERIFTELISFMEKKHSEVTEMIRAQEKAELSRTERLLEQLEQEIDDLQRRITEMEKLSHTHDDIHFLQEIEDLVFGRRSLPYDRPDFQSDLCEDSSSVTFNQHLSFQRVWKSLFDLKKRLEEICQDEFIKIPEDVEDVQILLSEPSRDEFLKYFCDLTLDPNTVNHHLVLSEENKAVSSSKTNQQYSDHPERFDYYSQVLSKESVCGRCYWEVEWSNRRFLLISVSYKDISRKGRGIECWFGGNNQSWSLECSPSSLFFWHNALKTDLRVPSSPRIGVYVDHSAGTLSFYSVSDTMKLLHRVHTTFTQPLYAGFWFSRDVLCKSTVRLCDQKQ